MPCIASSFRSVHKPCGSCNAIKSREWLNLIYKIAGGLSCRTDNVCSWRAPCKGGAFQWVQIPSGNRSSRKQSEQSWR